MLFAALLSVFPQQALAAEAVRELAMSEWDSPGPGFFSEGLAAVCKNGKWGYIDSLGRLLIPCQYDEASGFSEGLAKVKKDGKYGAINKTGKIEIPIEWSDMSGFSEGISAVVKGGKTGFIDNMGKVIVAPKYEGSGVFKDGMAVVVANGKYGFVDKTGKEVIAPRWDYAYSFFDGYAMVLENRKVGFIDKTGSVAIEPVWDDAVSFSEGYAPVMQKSGDTELWGYISTSGNILGGKIKYDSVTSFKDGLAVVAENRKYGVLKKDGNYLLTPFYEYVSMFNEGLASIKLNGKYGFVDEAGKTVIPITLDFAGSFSEGLAPAIKDNLWGYIDKKGAFAVSPQYNDAGIFVNGYAYVKKGTKSGFISVKAPEKITAVGSDFLALSTWALPELREAFEHNLCGPVMNMDLTKPVTREKFCEVVVRVYEDITGEMSVPVEKNPFGDTRNPEVLKAVEAGIVNGRAPDKFVPDALITREEICVMLERVVSKTGLKLKEKSPVEFADKAKVSAWAAGSVNFISSIGVVNGVGAGKFAPLDNTTIEQSVAMGLRLLNAERVS